MFLIVCTALLIHYERPIAAGALFGVYAIFRMTPLFILPIYFFFGNKYFVRKFTLGAGLSVASSFIYSLIFQFEYLIYWIVRVVLPESFEKYFNVEEITGLRIASNIYNDTFDFPTIWNIFNELSINQRLIPVLAFIFFFVVMYKLRSIDINNQLLAFCISYLVYYVVTPYNRPYHLLEVSFILIVFLSLGNINKLGVVTFASVIYPGFILLKYLDYIIFPDALVHFMYVSPVLCCISLLFYISIKIIMERKLRKICIKCGTNLLQKQIFTHKTPQRFGSTFNLSKKEKQSFKKNIRVNLVTAGPIRTMAAKSIPGFKEFEDAGIAKPL